MVSTHFNLGLYISSLVIQLISLTACLAQTPVLGHAGSIRHGSFEGSVLMEGPRSVYVSGDYAYIACSVSNSLTVIDVSNPNNPRPAGIIRHGENGANLLGANGVYMSNGLAFVASRWGQALEIIDVSDPTSPVHVSTLSDGENGAVLDNPYSLCISGNYALVCNNYGHNVEIVDISDPLAPNHLASVGTGIFPTAVVVKDNYAYVSTSSAMQIIDITNPASPFIASTLENGTDGAVISGGSGLYLSDGYIYITSAFAHTVEIIDVSNPLLPKHAGKTNLPDYMLNSPHGISVEGNFAFVTAPGAFHVLDVSNKNDPALVARLTNGDGEVIIGPTSPFIKDDYCYVVHPSGPYGGQLEIIDLRGPHPPSFLQTVDSSSTSFRVRWRKEIGAVNYFVDLFTDSNSLDGRFTNVSVNDTSFLFSGLTPLSHYSYRVRSFNGRSSSLSSGMIQVFTFITPVALPPSEITPTSFIANWSPITVSNWSSSYSFDIDVDKTFSDPFNIIVPGEYSGVIFTELPNDQTYYYRVRAGGYLLNGNIVYSPPSNIVTVALHPITGIQELPQKCIIEAFPVPASTSINVTFKGFDNCCEVSYAIYSLMGQIIYAGQSSSLESVTISLLPFSAGHYIIKAIQRDKVSVKTFVKN